MAPTPQDPSSQNATVNSEMDGEAVVISGMSGLYPDSNNLNEFSKILYDKVNPITAETPPWGKFSHPEAPKHIGVIPKPDRFDAQFFKVHYRLGNHMDMMARKVLEQSYQAIYDAGVTAEHLSGRNIGVYVASFVSESEKATFYDTTSKTGFSLTGSSKTMFPNRISYWLNAKGPSISIDGEGCCSHIALEQGYRAIKRGECEAAIIAGCNMCWHPQGTIFYGRNMPLSKDGTTKCFDQDAHGFVKSEAINVLFLQKAKDALRSYAELVYVKTSFNPAVKKDNGTRNGFVREPRALADFLKNFYEEAKVPSHYVDYVEAFGTAVPDAEKAELEAFDEVFCKNRTKPLLVGSVTSNIGYTEAAAGISGVTKVLLGYHTGELAGNINCDNPRQDVAGLRDGHIRIVTQHQRIESSYAAVNGLSLVGVNGHVLLRGCYKKKDPSRYMSSIPRLVTISGRQESCVQKIIEDLKSRPIDPEEIVLLHNIHEKRISGHMARGYIVLDTKNDVTESVGEKADFYGDEKRPLWFVYSGMGSQWTTMGAQLMRIPTFAAAIERCRRVLEPRGVDIVHIITASDKTIYDNILNSFVGIAAVQIGLTDILKELGLVPDKIIGHSVGELGCAYADGCFTAEQMILAAYARGLVSVQTPFIRGSMAAVGIGYEKVSKLCPPEIEVACHNGPDSSTISGPADAMKEFVGKLVEQGIFAKEVPCSNIAYHSRYIAEAGIKLMEMLSEVVKDPKLRSERWLSTSVPMDRWNEDNAKYCSAWYHTNNLLSPVLFEETSRLVPANALVVEVAPHGLLQAILKRSLHPNCMHVPLTLRGHSDNVVYLLNSIGKLYMEGYNIEIKNLYPTVEFPVSTGTPLLSHLVEWIHDEKWKMPYFLGADRKTSSTCKFLISIYDDDQSYLQGHVVREQMVYPFTAGLVAVWDTLAMTLGVPKKKISVQYRDVHLFAQPILSDQRRLQITVSLHRGTGRFEIMDEYAKIATGFITCATNIDISRSSNQDGVSAEKLNLDSKDVYEVLKERDYAYSGDFRSIYKTNTSFTDGQLLWNDNWATLLDGMIQLNVLGREHDTVSQPSHIGKISIDVKTHQESQAVQVGDNTVIPVKVSKVHGYTRCGGVLCETIQFYDLPILKEDTLALTALKFVQRFKSNSIDLVTTFKVYMQTVSENVNKDVIQVVGILSNNEYIFNGTSMKQLLGDVPALNFQYKDIDIENVLKNQDQISKADVVVLKNLSKNEKLCQDLHRDLRPGTFIINAEEYEGGRVLPSGLFRVVSSDSVGRVRLELGYWRPVQTQGPISFVFARRQADLATLAETRSNLSVKQKLTVITTYPPVPGLKDLVKKWRKDSKRNQVYLVMIGGNKNIEQLPELDLAYNVLFNDVWGGEYYVTCKEIVAVEHAVTLKMAKIGDLDTLQWVEMAESSETGVKVTVRYAGINDLDVKRATGVVPFKQNNNGSFGMDYSGTTESNERVMGIVRGGAASGRVQALHELMWPVPAHWTLEDAATVPSAYAQAFYLLGIRSKLNPGMTVLVHGGAGALGQAAISVALANGCEVFTTVGDIRKKVFLQRLFPDLKGDNIGNSRDHTFGDMVLQATAGNGCDVVISCVKGDLKNTTLSCAAFCGVTYDTAQTQSEDTYAYGMYSLTKQRSYVLVDFSSIFDYKEDMKELHSMMCDGISRGYVRPLSRVTYAPKDAPRAFRLLAASRHRGRVLLHLRDSVVAAQPRLTCSPDHCHLLICDKEGYGLLLADRLVSRGAKTLHVHCSKITPRIQLKMQSWQKMGVHVVISSEDLSSKAGVVSLFMDSIRMGAVEGVYFIISTNANEKKVEKFSTIVSNIDLVSRESCPSIRYFAVVTTVDTIGHQACHSRARNKLPATLLHLPSLHNQVPVSWRSALDATEMALRSKQPLLLAQPQIKTRIPLLNKIATIADIKIPEGVKNSETLTSLGLDNSRALEISTFLQYSHNVSFTEEDIPQLSVAQIQELDEVLTKSDFSEVKGLDTFISHVGSDVLYSTKDIVFMPTLYKEVLRSDEMDTSETYMCLVPGLEGHHNRFRSLCYGLKLPVIVLQPGLEYLNETPRETAKRYAKILLSKLEMKTNFFLLGYESGVITALELASILEDEGLVGTVYCVGGSPKEIQATLNEQLEGLKTDEELQGAVARHMSKVMAGDDVADLEDRLKAVTTWQETVDACVSALRSRVSHSMQYSRLVIEAVYARIKQIQSYKPQPIQLRSRLVVLYTTTTCRDKTPAHSLKRYSQNPIVEYELSAPLSHAVDNPRCTTFINRHLGADVLEAFEKKNLCQTYVLNMKVFTMRKYMPDNEKDQVK